MTKRLIASLIITAFLAAGCKKKSAEPKAEAADPATAPMVVTPAGQAAATLATNNDEVTKLLAGAGAVPDAQKAERITKTIAATETMMRGASRDWDPASVIASVGKDRAALFMWVRDKTALVPYRGSLRGAVGVMMDRLGNSLDRSLLLAELLKQAGLEVRLATASLDNDTAQKLATTWSARSRPTIPAPNNDDAVITQLVKDLGVDPTAFHDKYVKLQAAQRDLAAQIHKRIDEQAASLGKLVPASGGAPASAAEAFTDHWWVQVHDGELWSDLDPSLPDAAPGHTLASAATETLAPDDLADDRRHTLTIRIIGELWHDQARDEAVLVEHTFAPASFYGQRILITNVPIDMPDPDALRAAKQPVEAARTALTTQTEWIPMVMVGATPVVKMSVTDGGELYDLLDAHGNSTRLARAVQHATKAGVGGATNMLDQLPDDTGTSPPPKPPIAEHSGFTAEWVEYEVRAPGAEPRVVRRKVFDAIGSAADRATARPVKLSDAAKYERGLALIGQTQVLPMFSRIPDSFVADRVVKALVAARPLLIELASLGTKPASKDLLDRFAKLPSVPGALEALGLARFDWSTVDAQVFIDRIDVITSRRRLIANGSDLRSREHFDIVTNGVNVWPTKADPRTVRIAQGIADTSAEALLVACSGAGTGCVRGPTTSEAFAASKMAGWSVATSETAPAWTQLPPEPRVLARADLAAGYAIVVPPGMTNANATWWRVRPDTGETLGMGLMGGNAMVESLGILLTTSLADYYCLVTSSSESGAVGCIAGSAIGATGAFIALEKLKMKLLGFAIATLGLIVAGESNRTPSP